MNVLSRPKLDVHRSITQKIIKAIEDGAGEYRMPWHRCDASITRPLNAYTGLPYRGVNVLGLWVDAQSAGYSSGHWATYRQWNKLGAQVRKGEHGSLIVFYKDLSGEHEDGREPDCATPRLVARASRVFNADQVDGWSPIEDVPARNQVETLEGVQNFVCGTGADIRHVTAR